MRAATSLLLLACCAAWSACGNDTGGSDGSSGAGGGAGIGGAGAVAAGQGGGGAGSTAGIDADSGTAGTGISVGDPDGGVIVAPRYPSPVLDQGDDGCAVTADDELVCWDLFLTVRAQTSGCLLCVDAVAAVYGGREYGSSRERCVRMPSGAYRCTNVLGDIPAETNYVQVVVGVDKACGLSSDGTVECWDRGFAAPLVSGAPAGRFIQLAHAGEALCGLRPEGVVECWDREVPNDLAFDPNDRFVQFSASEYLHCGVKQDGHLACAAADKAWPLDVAMPSGKAKLVSVAGGHGCAIMEDDSVQCFGSLPFNHVAPSVAQRFKAVSAGPRNDCGIDLADKLWCWGSEYTDVHAMTGADGAQITVRHVP